MGNLLIVAFFAAALLYSSAGFGGGSTYTALLVFAGVDHRVLPVVSLMCNAIVVTGSCVRFARRGDIDWRSALPLCVVSVPMAVIGGVIDLPRDTFVRLLGVTLLVAGALMLVQGHKSDEKGASTDGPASTHRGGWTGVFSPVVIGGALGLLAGLVGIGGGIFLSPVLHFARWDNARRIAAVCSLFILVNSIAGLAGHFARRGGDWIALATEAAPVWPWLFVGVFVGGQIGNRLATQWFSLVTLRRVTAALILAAATRLLFV